MSSHEKPSSGSIFPGIIIGALLMVGGTYLSINQLSPMTETFTKQGLDLDLGMTVATIGVFLILFPVIKFFFIGPLTEAIDHRNQELEHTFSDAETLRADMQKLRDGYEKQLAESEASARTQIEAQIKEAQSLRQTLVSEATAKADDLLRKATEEIESEKVKAIIDIRLHVVDLTLSATEKILGQNIDAEVNRRLVNEFIDRVEVAP